MFARYILEFTCGKAVPGMTTDELDSIAHEEIVRRGGYPSPLNYAGFPKSICTSLNHVACHGIPSPDDVMEEGDLLSVDVSIFYKGFHGDNCMSVVVGGKKANPDAQRLIEVNEMGLDAAIVACAPGRSSFLNPHLFHCLVATDLSL
jgi:methionyl aminopeptidase